MDISKLIKWQKHGNRGVKIEIEHNNTSIWVYDYDLIEGKHLSSVDEEIDLQNIKEDGEKSELERLKAKYE